MVEPDDKRLKEHRIHPPFEEEFGQQEMRFFRSYFHGYLTGRWETLPPEQRQPFLRCVPAAHILFGYNDGVAFEEAFDSAEEYEAARDRLQKQVERERESNSVDACIVLTEPSSGARDRSQEGPAP